MQKANQIAQDFFGKFSWRGVLGLIIVTGCFTFLFLLMFKPIPQGNESALNVAMGFVLGVLGVVAGYYFGSSKDKSDADKATSTAAIMSAASDSGTDAVLKPIPPNDAA